MDSKSISRRGFLKSAGVLVATASLPSVAFAREAQEQQEHFPRRGRFERLALSYVTVKIGLEHPFSVLHVSDTHLTDAYPHESEKKQILKARRSDTFGGHQEEALRDTLAWAKMNVDYVLHTGDLIDWQSEANYDLVRKYFGDAVVSGCLGNHEYSPDMWLTEPKADEDEAFKSISRNALQQVFPFDIELQSQVINGVNFVSLDDVYGTVTESQVKRFKNEVAKGLPIVLCMHVPFYTPDINRANSKFWKGVDNKFTDSSIPAPSGAYKLQQEDPVTRDFISCLKNEPLLKAILAGHLHITIQDRFSDTAMEYVVGGNFLFHAQEVLFV